MKVNRINASNDELGSATYAGWRAVEGKEFPLVATPLKGNPQIKAISPFIEKSVDHGSVTKLNVACAHNGERLAIYLTWESEKHDKIVDLDEFVDGVAVMFPLTAKASAVTMGSPSDPVNAWYWKGNLDNRAFDVIATGYGTSGRRNDPEYPIQCNAEHRDGSWHVVMSREFTASDSRIAFYPGQDVGMAFAVWDGGNRERSGRKSFSGDFARIAIDK